MKKYSNLYPTRLLYFFLALFLFAACSEAKSVEVEKEKGYVDLHGALSVKGTKLVDEHGEPMAMKGVSLGWHNWHPRFYTEQAVSTLAQNWNCKLIRAAIGADPDGAYIADKEFANKCLDEVVESAIANNMYVIIDWHSHEIHTKEATEFFTRVATKYKDYPNIIYEIFNEPVEDSWEEVKQYSIDIIKAIRAIDSHNVILIGSPHWDQDIHLAADSPIQGFSNLMYTLHFYAATHKQDLRNRGSYALSKGLPIFISECAAMEATGDGALNLDEWNKWTAWAQQNHIPWVAWSLSDKNETCSMVQNKQSPASNWADDDLKEWGIIIKNELTK